MSFLRSRWIFDLDAFVAIRENLRNEWDDSEDLSSVEKWGQVLAQRQLVKADATRVSLSYAFYAVDLFDAILA